MNKRLPDCLIDLHLHLDGSLDVSTVRQLAMIQDIDIPLYDEILTKELTVSPDCHDLNEYLEKFQFPLSLLQTPEALKLAAFQLKEKLQEQGLIYAEIRFAPLLHRQKGMSIEEVVDAVCSGWKYSDFKAGMILCCYRGDDLEDNLETVRVARKYLGKGVVAIDLAGAEALFPNEMYEEVFKLARELGVPFTIHSGEASGPKSVWKALQFGTKRIGHGVRSTEDPELMKKLAEEGITLELCPTSNLHTCIYSDIKQFPLRKLLDNNIRVTVNTDNMTVSGTTVRDEFNKLIEAFDLKDEEVKQLLINSAEAAFLPQQEREELKRAVISAFAE